MSHCVPRLVNIDGPTRALALTVLPALQVELPGATIDDLYRGAARLGMNRLHSKLRPPSAADLAYRQGTDVQALIVLIWYWDSDRANQVGAPYGLNMYCVLSCAVCTGVRMMAGDDVLVGPFELP